MTPPPATIRGRSAVSDQLDRPRERRLVGQRPRDVPDALREEVVGIVVGLGLHVLREGERHRAGLGLVDEDAHRLQRRRHDLLGPPDPVEVARDRAEAVVHGDVTGRRILELLQHGVGPARGEDVAGEQQHGQPVHGREGGAGDHVRRPRPDRARARERPEAVAHPRVAGRDVHHPLLAARLVVGQELGVLVQRLPDPGDVAVPEDPEAAAEEAVLDAVALDVLRGEEADERLRGSQPHDDETSARIASSSCSSSASSAPPAIRRTSSCRSMSFFA